MAQVTQPGKRKRDVETKKSEFLLRPGMGTRELSERDQYRYDIPIGYRVPRTEFHSLNEMMNAYTNRPLVRLEEYLQNDVLHKSPNLERKFPETLAQTDPRCVNEFLSSVLDKHNVIVYNDPHELGPYCFTREEVPLLTKYKMNPYSGRDLNAEFLQSIGTTPVDEKQSFASQCTDEPDTPYAFPQLTQSTQNFAQAWIWDQFVSSKFAQWPHKLIRVPILPRYELAPYKSCEPIKHLYRGFPAYLEEPYIARQLPLYVGKQFVYESLYPTSWARDLYTTEFYANRYPSQTNQALIIRLDNVLPEDLLMDPGKLKKEWSTEVVLLPGRYLTTIVYVAIPNPLANMESAHPYRNNASVAEY